MLSRIPREATVAANPHMPPPPPRIPTRHRRPSSQGLVPLHMLYCGLVSNNHSEELNSPPLVFAILQQACRRTWKSSHGQAPPLLALSTHAKSSSLPSAVKIRHVSVSHLNKQHEETYTREGGSIKYKTRIRVMEQQSCSSI